MSIFKGLRVIELASVLAGPSVGQFFAELGAEVIKVEPPSGDVTRSWKSMDEPTDDRSAYFSSVNWGKKSWVLDLTSRESKEKLYQLVKLSDIVIASYKYGDAEKLGVDYQTLTFYKPNLIYGQITGYGSTRSRVGYDAIVQAEAGFMSMNGEKGGRSLKMPVALVDVLAGHHLKEALLMALLHKERNGEGTMVEVSLIEAAVSSLVNQAANWLVGGKIPQKLGSLHPNIAPYGEVLISADDKEIIIAVGNDKQFQSLCTILLLDHLAIDPQYSTNALRVQNRAGLSVQLQERFNQFKSKEIISLLSLHGIPAGIIQNMKEVFDMEEIQNLLIHHANFRGVRTFSGTSPIFQHSFLSAPPHLGEHDQEILTLIKR